MVLSLEERFIFIELLEDWVDSFEVVVLESLELLDSSKQVNQLGDSSAEEIELSEDLVWGELKLLALRHVHESLLGELVLLQVSSVEIDARLKHWNKLFWRVEFVIPKDVITLWALLLAVTVSDSDEVQNVVLAVVDHLVRDLHEETGHSLVGVVVSGDGVDHLDTVHQSWKGVLDSLWVSVVEWLDEFLESLKILDVIFGLVESFGDSKLNGSPLGGG